MPPRKTFKKDALRLNLMAIQGYSHARYISNMDDRKLLLLCRWVWDVHAAQKIFDKAAAASHDEICI